MAKFDLTPDIERAFTFLSPFTALPAETMCRVLSSESFEGALARSLDVKEFYYFGNGLSEDDYLRDYNARERLLTLRVLDDNSILNIPSSYIDRVSQAEEFVPYRDLVVSAPLGLIPMTMDIEPLLNDIRRAIEDRVGQTVETTLIALPSKEGIPKSEANAIETARQAKIFRRPSPSSEVNRLTAELEDKLLYIKQLENALKASTS